MRINTDGDIEHIAPDDLVTAHFRCREFEKGARWPASWYDRLLRLAAILERVRTEVKAPLLITSGYRSAEHNASTGGAAKRSQHIHGRALDFRCYGLDDLERQNARTTAAYNWLIEHADEMGIGGLGWYPPRGDRPACRVHVDLRGRAVGAPVAKWTA